ncbi:HAAS signaling domain-containing protein [Kaistella carnis]|uniref:HAAS signaling domain-containing protein n=1 Tax=Kaistella carnis TaxID=1241979 RepID=UPI0028A279BE|nr:hypothetical protein [Kaistella carnis]
MKIENLKFSEAASKRVYQDYMNRIKKATKSLSQQNQDDIYMEFNSHIFEAMNHNNQRSEIDALLDILEKLGPPEEVLKLLVADKKLEQATKTFNPIHILKALILNFTNGISYVIFFILYLLLFGFVFLIFAKISNPAEVGLYYKDHTMMVLGIPSNINEIGVKEILGNWFIPVMLLSIVVFYFIITLLLKLKKSINRKK